MAGEVVNQTFALLINGSDGKLLKTNKQWYDKTHNRCTNKVKHYKTIACKTCPVKDVCTRN